MNEGWNSVQNRVERRVEGCLKVVWLVYIVSDEV